MPDIDNGLGSGIGVGLLFADPARPLPDPYHAQSSSEDGDIEDDLDKVASIRRSLVRKPPKTERAKKGWLAHQSVFPASSSSSDSDSEKETEAESEDEGQTMAKSKREPLHSQLEQPLLGPEELDGMSERVPVRLQVYHGHFGHWERGGLRKYKGG